jgi:hypothetical protein
LQQALKTVEISDDSDEIKKTLGLACKPISTSQPIIPPVNPNITNPNITNPNITNPYTKDPISNISQQQCVDTAFSIVLEKKQTVTSYVATKMETVPSFKVSSADTKVKIVNNISKVPNITYTTKDILPDMLTKCNSEMKEIAAKTSSITVQSMLNSIPEFQRLSQSQQISQISKGNAVISNLLMYASMPGSTPPETLTSNYCTTLQQALKTVEISDDSDEIKKTLGLACKPISTSQPISPVNPNTPTGLPTGITNNQNAGEPGEGNIMIAGSKSYGKCALLNKIVFDSFNEYLNAVRLQNLPITSDSKIQEINEKLPDGEYYIPEYYTNPIEKELINDFNAIINDITITDPNVTQQQCVDTAFSIVLEKKQTVKSYVTTKMESVSSFKFSSMDTKVKIVDDISRIPNVIDDQKDILPDMLPKCNSEMTRISTNISSSYFIIPPMLNSIPEFKKLSPAQQTEQMTLGLEVFETKNPSNMPNLITQYCNNLQQALKTVGTVGNSDEIKKTLGLICKPISTSQRTTPAIAQKYNNLDHNIANSLYSAFNRSGNSITDLLSQRIKTTIISRLYRDKDYLITSGAQEGMILDYIVEIGKCTNPKKDVEFWKIASMNMQYAMKGIKESLQNFSENAGLGSPVEQSALYETCSRELHDTLNGNLPDITMVKAAMDRLNGIGLLAQNVRDSYASTFMQVPNPRRNNLQKVVTRAETVNPDIRPSNFQSAVNNVCRGLVGKILQAQIDAKPTESLDKVSKCYVPEVDKFPPEGKEFAQLNRTTQGIIADSAWTLMLNFNASAKEKRKQIVEAIWAATERSFITPKSPTQATSPTPISPEICEQIANDVWSNYNEDDLKNTLQGPLDDLLQSVEGVLADFESGDRMKYFTAPPTDRCKCYMEKIHSALTNASISDYTSCRSANDVNKNLALVKLNTSKYLNSKTAQLELQQAANAETGKDLCLIMFKSIEEMADDISEATKFLNYATDNAVTLNQICVQQLRGIYTTISTFKQEYFKAGEIELYKNATCTNFKD